MVEDIKFSVIENGILKEYIIIEQFNKNYQNYIIYKEDGDDDIYAALYEIIDDKIKIIPIEDNKDYDIVDNYLENL